MNRRILVAFTAAMVCVFASAASRPLDAQDDCDDCPDAPWGKTCQHGGGSQGEGCHQHEPDHCDFAGSCDSGDPEEPIGAADLTLGGSVRLASFAPATADGEATMRRSCDGAIILREYAAQRVQAMVARVERVGLLASPRMFARRAS